VANKDIIGTEVADALARAARIQQSKERGNGLDPQNYALISYDPQWQQAAMRLPVCRTEIEARPIQNADGSFKFMVDIDGLDETPLG